MSDTSQPVLLLKNHSDILIFVGYSVYQLQKQGKFVSYIKTDMLFVVYHLKPNCLCLAVPVAEAFSRFKSRGWDYKVRGLLSVLPSAVWPLVYFNLFSLLLFPWTLSILLSPGLIWYSTNWLHQKVIMLLIIVTLLFLPLFTSNLSTCESCFTGSQSLWWKLCLEYLLCEKKFTQFLSVIFKMSTF